MVSNFPQTIQLGTAGAIDGDHNDEDKDSKTLTVILKKKKSVMCQVSYSAFHLYCVTCCVSSHVQLFCDPMGYSPPGSSIHGISQARILECIAISFSRESAWTRDQICVSCISGGFFSHWTTREFCTTEFVLFYDWFFFFGFNLLFLSLFWWFSIWIFFFEGFIKYCVWFCLLLMVSARRKSVLLLRYLSGTFSGQLI